MFSNDFVCDVQCDELAARDSYQPTDQDWQEFFLWQDAQDQAAVELFISNANASFIEAAKESITEECPF